MNTRNWLTAEQLREKYPWLSEWMLKKFRKARQIPYLKVGKRTILYDLARVERALAKLEIQEVS